MLGERHILRRNLLRMLGAVALAALAAAGMARALPSGEPTVEDLKARLAAAGVGDKPHLCVQIAQKQLAEADKEYAAAQVDKGQAALVDVVTYSELARDYAIQSHKYEKQTEIAIRTMTRKLTAMLHLASHDDEAPLRDAIDRLQRARDDLLKAMFPKGAK
jgi:hypothetical protein